MESNVIKLKDLIKETSDKKYDAKKAMDFYGALQTLSLNLKQQSDPRTSDNREQFKKVHMGLQLLKPTPYHKEAKKHGQDYIKISGKKIFSPVLLFPDQYFPVKTSKFNIKNKEKEDAVAVMDIAEMIASAEDL